MKTLFAVAAVLVGALAYVLGSPLTASGQTVPPPTELPQPYLGIGGSMNEMEIEIRFPDYDPDYVGTMKIANESALYPNASFRWVPPEPIMVECFPFTFNEWTWNADARILSLSECRAAEEPVTELYFWLDSGFISSDANPDIWGLDPSSDYILQGFRLEIPGYGLSSPIRWTWAFQVQNYWQWQFGGPITNGFPEWLCYENLDLLTIAACLIFDNPQSEIQLSVKADTQLEIVGAEGNTLIGGEVYTIHLNSTEEPADPNQFQHFNHIAYFPDGVHKICWDAPSLEGRCRTLAIAIATDVWPAPEPTPTPTPENPDPSWPVYLPIVDR